MRHENKVINYESNEAASLQTVTGWVSSDGRFWGADEHMARYAGCTHRICEKNPAHGVHARNDWCSQCREERMQARYDAMPRKAYDGNPIAVYDGDTYFFDEDSLRDWLIEHEIAPKDAQLVFCRPQMASEIDPNDHFIDELSEDGEVSDRLAEAFAALNKVIREEPPLSWWQDDVVVVLPDDFLK